MAKLLIHDAPVSFDQIVAAKIARQIGKSTDRAAVIFVGPTKMGQLNHRYRGIKLPTDILSFESDVPGYIGEIYICPTVARRYAGSEKLTYPEVLLMLVSHGLLHLTNHHHDTPSEISKTFKLQSRILADVGIKWDYYGYA